ncbi:MAG TPA: phosphoadenosine phosphosulfate reductase family protein, partial [Fervidobacterium sp.]|nr:phosphoadenosine phosphosulfate reductase family protein [Fervidobacterium sp.]
VHKSAPTLLMLRTLAGKPSVTALIVEGVRREESQRRSVYSDVAIGYKHDTQTNIRPIIDWSSTEIYLYTFARRLPLNRAYRYGLARVGCSVCPFASGWSEYVIQNVYGGEVETLLDALFEYASMFTKEKDDLTEFVSSGKWKSRASGSSLGFGKELPTKSFNGCSLMFAIRNPNENWAEWVKAVGNVVMEGDIQGQLNVRDPSNPSSPQKILDFQLKKDGDVEVITVNGLSSDDKETIKRLGWVATKVSYCTHCQACQVECPTGALHITTTKVTIDQDRCIHCAECLWFGGKVCLGAKSLKMKEGAKVMSNSRIYLTDYSGFGIRQEWLRKLVEVGENWSLQSSGLGNKQFSGLRSWLKHAEIDISGKGMLSIDLLREFGSDSDFTWAVIWTNLARNSQIVRWYISQVKWGSVVSKDDCVKMTAEYFPNHTERTRRNAVTAIFELFTKSPIGSRLGIGIPSMNSRQQRVEKRGWVKPLGDVILYSLYRFAETNNRYEFTLNELYNSESYESPYALFGLAQTKLMSILRGISSTRPDLVRVEFVRDLDNVYLNRNYSPKEVLENVRLE